MSNDGVPKPWVGTPSQIEWAEQIRPRVGAEFDRVAATLEAVASRQSAQDRSDTSTLIAILQEKRAEVIARHEAGYFIKNWQEITNQVQNLVRDDPRFGAIRQAKAGRGKTDVARSVAEGSIPPLAEY
jgi:hypothetical protein